MLRSLLLLITLVLSLSGCGNDPDQDNSSGGFTFPDLSDSVVYDSNSPYADRLLACVNTEDIDQSCSLLELPLIGQQSGTVTVDSIMSRVLVSHPWMGTRFRELLSLLPEASLSLFGSTTAIIIDGDIRPAFYYAVTGALYIDPQYLWLSNDEKSDISPDEDYRSSYGADLAFQFMWRYVKDNDYAYENYSLTGNDERTLDDIKLPFTRIIFHELAHANDFVPPNEVSSLNINQSIFEAVVSLEDRWVSKRLYQLYALNSDDLYQLAEVSFQGDASTAEQNQMQANYVGSLMHNDMANHYYNYRSPREDVAMIFEATLMKHYYDMTMDIAFSDKPTNAEPVCADYIVGWGSRNRIANPQLRLRGTFIMQSILDSAYNWDTFYNLEVGSEIMMNTRNDWCENLLQAGVTSSRVKRRSNEKVNPGDFALPH